MPLFDFKCRDKSCGHTFEALVKANELTKPCEACHDSLADKQVTACQGVGGDLPGINIRWENPKNFAKNKEAYKRDYCGPALRD